MKTVLSNAAIWAGGDDIGGHANTVEVAVDVETLDSTCFGSGVEKRQREVQARIPAGVSDGQKIRLKGRGAPGRNGGPAGDLIVECHVVPHRTFGRTANNLTVHVPVSFHELALGGTILVPTLDGSTVTLRLKPGTQSGSRHRVKGKGVATAKGHGDLIVTVDVIVPTHLTDQQRAAIQALAEVFAPAATAADAQQPTNERSGV